MKKTLLLVALFAITASVSAQFNWGVKAGFNASTIAGMNDSFDEVNTNYRPGYHVGLMGQYMMGTHLGLESGLYYSAQGVNLSAKEGDGKVKFSPSYLQLPIAVLYKINVGQNLSLVPSLGVYLSYGIGGKVVMEGDGESDKVNFFGKTDGEEFANRFDMGATAGLNLQFNKFLIGLGYDYGFMKINKEKAEDGEKNLYNGNVKVSVGYFF